MNYHVTSDLFVMDERGAIISGPYKNRKSAVGRISDLKKREISAGVHGNLIAPAVEKITKPFKLDEQAFINAVRQRGVYPAVSKHAYQR